jgi:hypothetical protein
MGDSASNGDVQLNRRRIAGGGVLIGIGGLLGFTGMLLVSSAIISAARQRVTQLEQPPSELAKRTWQQARAATTAGAKAWRNNPPATVSS